MDLGMILGNPLSMDWSHKSHFAGCAFISCDTLHMVHQSLMADVLQSLIQVFVYCRLDYCNALLTGIAKGQMKRQQAVQNTAARLVSWAHHPDHAMPLPRNLHWLPVGQRVIF